MVLEKTAHELLESPVLVYNLEVEEYHTYFVSGIGVLVHNVCTKANGNKYEPEYIAKKYDITVKEFHYKVVIIMIKIVELFLSGELDADSFSRELLNDLELENQINQLIPKEAYYNKNHHIWNRLPYGSLLPDGFNCMAFIKRMCKFDGSIADNYNLFGTVEIIYKAVYPKTPCTELYETLAECYLHIAGECFEGPETEACIEKIVYEIVDIKPKSKRDKTGKELLKNLFHVTDNKRPRWIQGSEWPMGTKTPMQFIDSKRIKDETDEGREYIFRDYETGEEKRIVQYY